MRSTQARYKPERYHTTERKDIQRDTTSHHLCFHHVYILASKNINCQPLNLVLSGRIELPAPPYQRGVLPLNYGSKKWQSRKDSNLEFLSQSQTCYRYTMELYST